MTMVLFFTSSLVIQGRDPKLPFKVMNSICISKGGGEGSPVADKKGGNMSYICGCFYEKNIYLKDFGLHVNFAGNETAFKMSYGEVLCSNLSVRQQFIDKTKLARILRLYKLESIWRFLLNIKLTPFPPNIHKIIIIYNYDYNNDHHNYYYCAIYYCTCQNCF